MPDTKPEEVRMSDLHALDRRMSDHKLEVYQTLNQTILQLVKPMNDLTSEMKVSNKNSEHLEEKISKTIRTVEANAAHISRIDKEVVGIKTTQGGILGVSGKVFPMFFAGLGLVITLLLSVSIYFKAFVGI